MSTRRKIGDIVRVDGYQHHETPYLAQVVEHGRGREPDCCVLDCGDPDCKEWPVVLEIGADGAPNGERNFHVPECHMFDYDDISEKNTRMVLVKVRSPYGKDSFFRFSPPPASMQVLQGTVVFKVRDTQGNGPDVQGRAVQPDKIEILFTKDDALAAFSDYAIRAGGQFIPSSQLEPYRAALQAWLT